MKEKILEHIGNPEILEELYHENKADFSRIILEIPDDHSDLVRFWKIRLSPHSFVSPFTTSVKELTTMIVLALVTGLLTRLPLLFKTIPLEFFYFRDLPIVLFNGLILYTFWINKLFTTRRILFYSGLVVVLTIFMNLLPELPGDSAILSFIHSPLLLWCMFGIAYISFDFKNLKKRIEFIRFNGDLLVMTGLLLIAAAFVTMLTIALFQVIGLDINEFAFEYIGFLCGAASPIVAFFLIRKFPGITSKVTPVLARVFTPLIFLTLLVYLGFLIGSGSNIFKDRELLIVFNGMLLVVMAIIEFSITTLDKSRGRKREVLILFMLALLTMIINSIALVAIVWRMADGITANRLVVLVSNVLIFTNLVLIARNLYRTWFKNEPLEFVETTVAKYLPIYVAWTLVVIFILPFIFG